MNVSLPATQTRTNISAHRFTADQVDLIKRTICKGSTDDELKLFLYQAERAGLDPLARQIYAIKRGGSMTIQTSIDGFRLIAERTGKYAGQVGPFWCGEDGQWQDVWLTKKAPTAAKIGVLRHDFSEPCWGVARFDAYAKDNLWRSMPEVMIAKCAEALALRKAFPQELSGIYTSDEIDQATVTVDVEAATPKASPVKPALIAPPVDPETGECSPHTITAASPIEWGGMFVAAINAARSEKELDQWIKLNEANLEALEGGSEKAHARVMERLNAKKKSLQDNPADLLMAG